MDLSTPVSSMGWTKRNAAASVLLALDVQRREVGRRIAKLLEDRQWTHEDLAHEAQVSVKTVSRVVNGRHESRNDTIGRIAKALGVDRDDLWPRPAPLGLGLEDPYEAKLNQIESNQKLILRLLVGTLAQDLEPELDAEIRRVLQAGAPPSQADDEMTAGEK